MSMTRTAQIMDHVAARSQTSRQIADIYCTQYAGSLSPLEVFRKGQTVMRKGYKWVWINPGAYDVPVRRVSKNKFELILN